MVSISWFKTKNRRRCHNQWEWYKERNKHRSDKDKQESKDFEHCERDKYDHNKKEYSKIGITIYANFKLLQNDICQ